jgi:hypothetical protein
MLVRIDAGVVLGWVPFPVEEVDERCVVEIVRKRPKRNS